MTPRIHRLLRLLVAPALAAPALAQWPHTTVAPLTGSPHALRFRVADVNGDGRPDVVTLDGSTGALGWLENGSPGPWVAHSIASLGPFPGSLALVDANGDGRVDVVATRFVVPRGGDEALWFENPATGSSWTPHAIAIPDFMVTKELTVLDIDGDGRDDLLHSADDPLGFHNHVAHRGTGSGFVNAGIVAIHDEVTRPSPGDFDGDGDTDLAFVRAFFAFPTWRRNQSTPGSIAWGSGGTAPDCSDAVALDIDTDGDDDLLCEVPAPSNSSALLWSESTGAAFGPLTTDGSLPAMGVETHSPQAGDLDGDGDDDIVVGFETGGLPARYHIANLGGGSFAAPAPITSTAGGWVLRDQLFDMDGDGDLELVVTWQDAAAGTGALRIHWNERTFGDAVACVGQPNSTGVVGDLSVAGSATVAVDGTHLVATDLPPGVTTLFVAATGSGTGSVPPNSSGTLCLAGTLGRFAGPGQLLVSDTTGRAVLPIDLTAIPLTAGPSVVLPGQTLVFQAWHRDVVGGQATSNFTAARSVVFQ